MYQVLIVEDEMLVRLGLRNSIEWGKFNMEVVADVADGKAAWDIYEKNKPDLIITDLKMPVMGGMELIERIRESDKETVIIILSCLEDFELVRKAMFLGVLNYIPKLTMTEDETETILREAQLEMNNKKNSYEKSLLINNSTMEKEKLIKDFVFYNIYSAKKFEEEILKLKLNLKPSRLVLCIMEIDHYDILQSRFKDNKGQLIKLSMLNVLDELLSNNGRSEAFYDDESHYILIFHFKDISSEQTQIQILHDVLNNIRSVITTFFNTTVSFGISSVQNGYESLVNIYTEAGKALKHKFMMGSGIFNVSDSFKPEENLHQKLVAIRNLQKLLRHMNAENIKEYNKMIDEINNVLNGEKTQFQGLFYNLIQWIASTIHYKSGNSKEIIGACNNIISKCNTFDDIIQAYLSFISEITENAMKNNALSKEVFEAIKFIRINFCKDINLHQVAEHVKLSPSYLSSIFKKELQISFIKYLNELRVNKAKDMLLNTYLNSYEIAEKIGFTENTYFCKVFKKFVGVSPNEFRKQWINEWTGEIENEDN